MQRGVTMDMALVIEKAVAEMVQLRSQISQWMDEYEAGGTQSEEAALDYSLLAWDSAMALTRVAVHRQSTAESPQWRKQQPLLQRSTTRSCGISLCK